MVKEDQAYRSFVMGQVKGKNTKPELLVRKWLFQNGFRYRLHDAKLPGKPDIVLPKYKTVVFINGCFWHRHEGCKRANTPVSKVEYWTKKFESNVGRDKRNHSELKALGWQVLIVWECKLTAKNIMDELNKLVERIRKSKG